MNLDCQDIQEILSAQLDGESTLVEERRAELHLQACSQCQAFSAQLEDLSFTLLQEMDEELLAPDISLPECAPRSLKLFQPRLWLLMFLPTLSLLSAVANQLAERGAAEAVLPCLAFVPLTLWVARGQTTGPSWSELAPWLVLASATVFVGPVTALLILFAVGLRARRLHFTGNLLTLMFAVLGAEMFLNVAPRLGQILQVATKYSTSLGGLALATAGCLGVAVLWLWVFRAHWLKTVSALALSILLLTYSLWPMLSAFTEFQAVTGQLPAPRPQTWRVQVRHKFGTSVHASSMEFERWATLTKKMALRPLKPAPVSGKLHSYQKNELDGDTVVFVQWPEELHHKSGATETARVEELVQRKFKELDTTIQRQTEGSFVSFLDFHTLPRPMFYAASVELDEFSTEVEQGEYMVGFVRRNLELPIVYEDHGKTLIKGPTKLPDQEYSRKYIWSRPKNLDLSLGLEGWDDNEEGHATAHGIRINPLRSNNRFQGIEQRFLLPPLGLRQGDTVRVTAHLVGSTPHAKLALTPWDRDGRYRPKYRSAETIKPDYTTAQCTVPVERWTTSLEVSVSYSRPGPAMVIKGLTLEAVRDGVVFHREGLSP